MGHYLPSRAVFLIGSLISLIMIVILYGNVTLERKPDTGGDARQNISIGLNLSQHGVYRDQMEDPVYYRREPFYPFLIAAFDNARGFLGLERIPMACATTDAGAWGPCPRAIAQLKIIGIILFVIGAAAAFLLVRALTGSYLFALAAWVLTISSRSLLTYADTNITEIHAAALLTVVGLLGVYAVMRQSAWLYAALGFAVGLLVLTKTIFSLLWIPVAAIILAAGWKTLTVKRLALVTIVFVLCANALPVAWMTRNALVGGGFELVEKRSMGVLSIRASYNAMTFDEFIAGFFYYTPAIGERGMADWGFEKADYERLDPRNEDGFRRMGQKQYRGRLNELQKAYDPDQEGEIVFKSSYAKSVAEQVGEEARERILSDPIGHIRATFVLAYRAMFPERDFGYRRARAEDVMLSADWPFQTPRPTYRVRGLGQTLYNLATGIALLLVPIIGWLRCRDLGPLMAFVPAIYLHGAYAAATHFLPRYAYPEIPLRAAALCVLLAYLVRIAWQKVAPDKVFPTWAQAVRSLHKQKPAPGCFRLGVSRKRVSALVFTKGVDSVAQRRN